MRLHKLLRQLQFHPPGSLVMSLSSLAWALSTKVYDLLKAQRSADWHFISRLLNSSTSKASSICPSTLLVSVGLKRTRTSRMLTSRLSYTRQLLPLPSLFGWESCSILPPARSQSTLTTTPSISSRDTAFLMSMLRTVSMWPGASVVQSSLHPLKSQSFQGHYRFCENCTWPAYYWLKNTQDPGNNGLLLQSG